ncbi:hypothetical protein ACLESO_36700 [Pyxidicoccus sp. 3LG]
MPGKNLDLLQFYRSEIKFESDMLSSRLNAFISSQAFLVIAYAGSLGALARDWGNPLILVLPPSLALLGLVLALHAGPGIRAAHAVIQEWHLRQRELLSRAEDLEDYRRALSPTPEDRGPGAAVRDRFKQGTVFAKHAPWIFALAWCHFGALPIVLYVSR